MLWFWQQCLHGALPLLERYYLLFIWEQWHEWHLCHCCLLLASVFIAASGSAAFLGGASTLAVDALGQDL